jgi:hypothetical protein
MLMTDEDKSESKAKPGYGEKMRKKLNEEREKGPAKRTKRVRKKRARKMRR